jgi:uroporphyrin-III C-methyltransferase
MNKNKGVVYLVGAGPGDPELVTIKARRLLKSADVVLYDALLNPQLLSYCRKGAIKIFAGKRRNKHYVEQDEINRMLFKYSAGGKVVVRLKGGDPYLFGRGAEEREYLLKRGIDVRYIPGVSSLLAAPGVLGIPLTHRDYASNITVVSGHDILADSSGWSSYNRRKTLVVFMAFENLEKIVRKLIKQGWPASCALAVVSAGTLPDEKVWRKTLGQFNREWPQVKPLLKAPAMLIVGKVAGI